MLMREIGSQKGTLVLARGHYSASIVCLPLDADAARAMLPVGLELAPQAMTTAGTHPVLLLFGRHRDVRTLFLPFVGLSYHEAIVAVPFVRRGGDTANHCGPFSFMPVLYLDNWPAVILGWFYGYEKRRARVAEGADLSYDVRGLRRGTPLISGAFKLQGDTGKPSDFPLFDSVRDAFQQTFIARTIFGSFLCSNMVFHLDEATLQPISAEVRVQSPFLPGLAPATFQTRGIDEVPLGSFRLQVPWSLSAPFLCPRGVRSGAQERPTISSG